MSKFLLILSFVFLFGCGMEPGLMSTTPFWHRGDIPVRVCAQSYTGDTDEEARADVQDAIGWINARLGFELFRSSRIDCDVAVTLDLPVERHTREPGGEALIHWTAQTGPRVEINTTYSFGEVRQQVIRHELLHAAGLQHDTWDGSIMRPIQHPTQGRQWPPWISDADRDLLRRIYMPR